MKKLFLMFITVVIVCVSCGSQSSTPAVLGASENVIDVEALKNQVGLVFIPAKTSDIVKAKISREWAIAKAQESGGPFEEATTILAALGYLSEPSLETATAKGETVDAALLPHPLVWIISYEGVEVPSAGGPDTPHGTAHEYNVVIDATTGDYIMAFVYGSSIYVR